MQNLPSAKVTQKTEPAKPVKVDGFAELVQQLQEMTSASMKSQESLVKSIESLTKMVTAAGEQGVDMTGVINSINALTDKLAEKEAIRMPTDYEITFERDKYNLMKSGIRLTSVPSKLN